MSKQHTPRKTNGIVIATPAYGGNVTVNYANSLVKSSALFQSNGLKLNVLFLSMHSYYCIAIYRCTCTPRPSFAECYVKLDLPCPTDVTSSKSCEHIQQNQMSVQALCTFLTVLR